MDALKRFRVRMWILLVVAALVGFAVPSIAHAAGFAQAEPGIMDDTVIQTILDFLGVGLVGSLITSALLKFTDGTKFKPRTVLLAVCIVVAGAWSATFGLPAWTGDPELYYAGWLVFIKGAQETGTLLYEAVLLRIPGLAAMLKPPATVAMEDRVLRR